MTHVHILEILAAAIDESDEISSDIVELILSHLSEVQPFSLVWMMSLMI